MVAYAKTCSWHIAATSLDDASGNPLECVSFTRSNIGNISNVNLNGANTNRGYSNTHELSSVGNSSQSFDDDGYLTQSHTGIDLDWDEGGMLKQTVVGPGDTAGIEGTNEYGYYADCLASEGNGISWI